MATTGRVRSSALIGRARELDALEEAFRRLAEGQLWALDIIGEAGIGKSRLVSEVTSGAEQRGYLVLDGRAAEFEREAPFGLLLDALNDYLGSVDPALLHALGEDASSELAGIFPSLAAVSPASGSRRLEAERYRAHYAIRALLERLAAHQPLVLALDDMHWADEGSIETVAHLLRRFEGPLLIVCACRQAPVRLAAALNTAERAGRCARLELSPLAPADADALLDPALDPAARAAVYRESGGNPFYVEELGRAAAQLGSMPASHEAPLFAADELDVPASVAGTIRHELAALPAGERRVLEAAAVAGESFEPELVAAIAELPEAAVLAGLDGLLAADFVRPTDAPRRFRFRHPIVRRAVYQWTPRASRLAAHSRAAAALEAAGSSLAARAAHVERSAAPGDQQAITLLIDAARAAAPRAPKTAGRRLRAALGLLPQGDSSQLRLALLSEAADAFAQAGVYDEALDALVQALELVPADDGEQHARLIAQIAAVKRQTGAPLQSRELLDDAFRSLSAAESPAALTLRVEIAIDEYFRGEFARLGDAALALMDHARGRDDRLLTSLAGALASLAASSLARIDDALAPLGDALGAFDLIADERLTERLDVCGWLGMAAFALEQIDDALRCVQRGLALARATGHGSTVPGLLALQVQVLLLAGRVSEAGRVADTAVDAALLSGNEQLIVWASEAAAKAAIWAGDSDAALANAREALAHSERLQQSFFSPLARLRLAGALYAAGDAAGCRAELTALEAARARQLLDLAGAHGWELLTRCHLALGDLDAAEDAAARAEARAATTLLPQQSATAACARAAVLLFREQHQAATRAADAAIACAQRSGNPLLTARARALRGYALAAAGDRDEAIATLEQAYAALIRCGAIVDADAAARALRRLGKRVHRRRPTATRNGAAALTAREREVADQVARGHTNREVAATLFLSEKTIESHLARIYDKLGVRSRTALATTLLSGADGPGRSKPVAQSQPG